MPSKPTIVCLCGSTRFMDAFFAAGWALTLDGQIVLSVGVCKHADGDGAHGAEALGQDVADKLDELHLRKIDLADWVLVLNVGAYYGDSTAKEVAYAKSIGKPLEFLVKHLPIAPYPPDDSRVAWDVVDLLARRAHSVAMPAKPKARRGEEKTDG